MPTLLTLTAKRYQQLYKEKQEAALDNRNIDNCRS